MKSRRKHDEKGRTYHIHLAVSPATSLGRGILDGFAAYGGHRTDWRCGIVAANQPDIGPPHADALLGGVTPEMAKRWDASQRRRVINTSRSRDVADIASVTCDDVGIARLAAEHLLGKELPAFTYFGPACVREEAFAERIRQEKARYCAPLAGTGRPLRKEIEGWLAKLPHCTGIMTFNDGFAVELLWAAQSAGRAVPEDLAVIGVDADPVDSLLAPVPITSVNPDFYSVGYRAAELLDRVLRGCDAGDERIRIPAAGVIEQASTDFPGIGDSYAVETARHIRRHACTGIDVADVVAAMPLSRRPLERRFQRAFGRTILQEIHRVRIAEAAGLLARSDLSISGIAARSGFSSRTKLTQVFSRVMGMSPSEYRRLHGGCRHAR